MAFSLDCGAATAAARNGGAASLGGIAGDCADLVLMGEAGPIVVPDRMRRNRPATADPALPPELSTGITPMRSNG
jgi:hypothetical protein